MAGYRLLRESGEDLGPFTSSAAVWRIGHLIPRATFHTLEVVRGVQAEPDEDDIVGPAL